MGRNLRCLVKASWTFSGGILHSIPPAVYSIRHKYLFLFFYEPKMVSSLVVANGLLLPDGSLFNVPTRVMWIT